MTALQRFMVGLIRMVDAAKDKNHPAVKDSVAAIKEHAALLAVAEVAAKVHAHRADCLELTEALAALALARMGRKARAKGIKADGIEINEKDCYAANQRLKQGVLLTT